MKKKLRLLNLAKTFIIIIFSLNYPFFILFHANGNARSLKS